MSVLTSRQDAFEMVRDRYPWVKWNSIFGNPDDELVAQKTILEQTQLTLLTLTYPDGFSYTTLDQNPDFGFENAIPIIFDLYFSVCKIQPNK
jgi:hypothetical protein